MKKFQFEGKGNVSGNRVRERCLRACPCGKNIDGGRYHGTGCNKPDRERLPPCDRLRAPRPDKNFRRFGGLADRIGIETPAAGRIAPPQ